MNDIILKIRENYNNMSKSEKALSNFIMENTFDILSMTANDIAKKSGVSSATVIRYVKKLGISGLDAFKLNLASNIENEKENKYKIVDSIISKDDDLKNICLKMFNRTQNSLEDFFYQLDYEQLELAINKVKSARHIYTLGIGASYSAAYDCFHRLRRAGFDANCYMDINMFTEFLNYVDERDVLLAFSYSGQSKEVLYTCEQGKKRNATIIAITRNIQSPLMDIADISLKIPASEDVLRIGAFESLQSSMMMGFLLYLGAIHKDIEKIEVELIKTRKLVEGLKQTDEKRKDI